MGFFTSLLRSSDPRSARWSKLSPPLAALSFRPRVEILEDRLAPATLNAGFTEATVATGLSSATSMEFAPDGKLFITEQAGTMEVWSGGSRLQANFFRDTPISTDTVSERGLLGVAFDPNYAANRFVYVYYTTTAADRHNRVSRFTANAAGDLALAGSETILLELDPHSAGNHNGGALRFGLDGRLYIATGDNANGANAQLLSNLHGKMLRINADGSIPTDNPFFGSTTGNNRAIWALGLRNPFTFAFQPGTGRLFINDVGQNSFEEINDGIAGSNYGWPGIEGNNGTAPGSPGTYRGPVYTYGHSGTMPSGFAIAGGAFYNPTSNQFGASFTGDYFFADFVSNWIYRLDYNTATGTFASTPIQFASGAGNPVDLRVDNAGFLYYLSRGNNAVYQVSFTGSTAPSITQPPQNTTVTVGQAAAFSVIASGSPVLTYQWQRNNGGGWNNIAGATASTYSLASPLLSDNGAQFRVVVTNGSGNATSSAATLTVTTNQAPTATILTPSSGTRFTAGVTVNFTGQGIDPEDGTLAASRFTWQVDYITSIASGTPVLRPFVAPFSGATGGSFTPATTGPYTLTDVAYRITLTVTDSNGRTSTTFRDLTPNTATITVQTNVAGLTVTLDGQPYAPPILISSVVGFIRPLGAPLTQTIGGITYTFISWSDGGAATHDVATPASATTYTATYSAPAAPPNPIVTPTITYYATGADAGGGPQANVYNAATGALVTSFFPFAPTFTGGVRVAVGDVNNDGTSDIIAGAGPGAGPQVTVFDGNTFQPILSFFGLPAGFTGGVYVAAGDVNRDGFADVIVSADRGGGPQVTITSGRDGSMLASFFATTPTFTGGIRVAAGDINGDGFADVIAVAGPGGGPQVTIFDGRSLSVLTAFYALTPTFTGGLFIAAGDVNNDGRADLIAGADRGGGPQVTVFNGPDLQMLASFFALPPQFTGGVRVGFTRNFNGRPGILSTAGPGGGPQVTAYDGTTLAALGSFFAYNPAFGGGVFIGG